MNRINRRKAWTPKRVQNERPRVPVRLPIGVIVQGRIRGRIRGGPAGDLLAFCSLAFHDTKLQRDIHLGAWTWFAVADALNHNRPLRG